MLTDDSLMPFGANEGKRAGDVPDTYWMWFLNQPWSAYKPDFVDYAMLRLPGSKPAKSPEQRKKPAYVPSKVVHPDLLAPWEE